MMNDLLYQYNPWWDAAGTWEKSRPRDRYVASIMLQLSQRRAILLTGLRRVGKSTIMRLVAKSLIDKGVDASTILYVSLDDYQLRPHSILDVLDAFRALHRHVSDQPLILLLDEIAAQKDFHQQLKTIQ